MALGLVRRYDAAFDALIHAPAFVVSALVIAPLATAHAQGTVNAEGCGALDTTAVGRHLDVEIGGPEISRGLVIELRCSETAIAIAVRDPLTGKSVEREANTIDTTDPEAPRVVAILVSGLVLASWAELLLRSHESPEGADPEQARAARDRVLSETAVEATEEPPRSEPAPRPAPTPAPRPEPPIDPAPELSLSAAIDTGVRIRDVAALFAAGDFGARATLRLTPWLAAGIRASGEIARVARASGHVTYASIGGSAVLAFVPIRRADLFELEVALEPRGGWARLDGGSNRPGVIVSALDSFLFEIDVTVAPTLVLDALELALVLRAGVTIIGPTGRVGGEPSVAIPGFAGGASLRAGIR